MAAKQCGLAASGYSHFAQKNVSLIFGAAFVWQRLCRNEGENARKAHLSILRFRQTFR